MSAPPKVSVEDRLYSVGSGNWRFLKETGITLERIFENAADWAKVLEGVEKPWLCWNVDPDWCTVQQRLVHAVGWTPVVGFDPRVGPPPLERGSILIDFNRKLNLPTMWLHFPLEFSHLYCDRLAFWHADCLIRFEKMQRLASDFADLPDGAIMAVAPTESLIGRLIRANQRRYWEVVGCTTRAASRSCYENGCGWWVNFAEHPSNTPEMTEKRAKYYWDSGSGIRYWHLRCGGDVRLIPESFIAEGHFTLIGRQDYQRRSPINYRRNLSLELSLNNDLVEACRKLGIQSLLEAPMQAHS